jgi:type III pantothenate kinase
MNLLADIGNSRIKVAVSDAKEIIWSTVMESITIQDLQAISEKYTIHRGIVSSVRKENEDIFNLFRESVPRCIVFDENTKLPVKNSYKTPETLGKDRLAAAIGANFLFPDKNILIIDAGTAITYDIITDKAEYLGGNIAPGLSMRFKALNTFTDKLPLFKPREEFTETGTDTENAIISGVQMGILYEIEGYIRHYTSVYPSNLQVVLTGGDSIFFEKRLKNCIFADSNIILLGLNRILEYNS